MTARDIRMTISWFETAFPVGPAYGDPEIMPWDHFTQVFKHRREGVKDGPCFATARFKLEADNRHVRRLKGNVIARTAVALDIEANKETGEIPTPLEAALDRVRTLGKACLGYTSHSHRPGADRYRLVFPLSAELDPEIPASEIVAKFLRLDGVLDRSKRGPSSLFYLPSSEADEPWHQCHVIDGAPLNADALTKAGQAILDAEAANAQAEAVKASEDRARRRLERLEQGIDPDDSLIEKIRARLDLADILRAHAYDQRGTKWRHPNSSSGMYGADIKTFGGTDRVFSHNASDPLHAENLPDWCTVTAIDAFDVAAILQYGADRNRAMREMAERFGLTKAAEQKALAKLLFQMIRQRAAQAAIETAAYDEGKKLGLSHQEICRVARYVADSFTAQREAA
jgi:hypothetical protein